MIDFVKNYTILKVNSNYDELKRRSVGLKKGKESVVRLD